MQSHYLFFLMFTSSQENVLLFCGRDYIVVGLTLSSKIESRSWRSRCIQHDVIKIVSDLRRVGGVPRVLRFPPPIKRTATILLK